MLVAVLARWHRSRYPVLGIVLELQECVFGEQAASSYTAVAQGCRSAIAELADGIR